MYTWIPNEERHLSRYSKRSVLVQPFSTLRIVVFKVMIDPHIYQPVSQQRYWLPLHYMNLAKDRSKRGGV